MTSDVILASARHYLKSSGLKHVLSFKLEKYVINEKISSLICKDPLVTFVLDEIVTDLETSQENLKDRDINTQGRDLIKRAVEQGLKLDLNQVCLCVISKRTVSDETSFFGESKKRFPDLQEELAKLNSKVIVCLGEGAFSALSNQKVDFKDVKGKWFNLEKFEMIATLHPVNIIKNPSLKRDLWEDLKQVIKKLGI